MKLQNKTKSTVGKWILQKVNTPAWRAGNITGYKHYNHKDKEDSLRLLMEEVGSREQFMQQVRDLKHAGLITVKYGNVNTTVEEIIEKLHNFPKDKVKTISEKRVDAYKNMMERIISSFGKE